MKYISARFTITDSNGKNIEDEVLTQAVKDLLCECAGEAGFESFEEYGQTLVGYAQKQLFGKAALDNSISTFPIDGVKITYDINDVAETNWNRTWEEQGFAPITIEGKCVIHDTVNPADTDKNDILDITIDTKQAFGTGNHETTFMIVNELFDVNVNGKRVLDCGCGTGILSVVAAKLGASAVTGYDIDEWSVENTRHNCELNNVSGMNVMLGNSDVLTSINQRFDIVLANINRNILLADMPRFRSVMAEYAILILSGFYDKDADMLISKAEELSLRPARRVTRNDWCMLTFESCRPSGNC